DIDDGMFVKTTAFLDMARRIRALKVIGARDTRKLGPTSRRVPGTDARSIRATRVAASTDADRLLGRTFGTRRVRVEYLIARNARAIERNRVGSIRTLERLRRFTAAGPSLS